MNGRRGITPTTALRLKRLFSASAAFWLGMQQNHALWHELHSPVAAEVEKIEPMHQAA